MLFFYIALLFCESVLLVSGQTCSDPSAASMCCMQTVSAGYQFYKSVIYAPMQCDGL